MKLTGKCKEGFESYLASLRKHETNRGFADIDLILHHQGYDFYNLPNSMKYGVLLDYFDSVGIDVDVFKSTTLQKMFYFSVDNFDSPPLKGRPEARTSAVEKANEIYNVSK